MTDFQKYRLERFIIKWKSAESIFERDRLTKTFIECEAPLMLGEDEGNDRESHGS